MKILIDMNLSPLWVHFLDSYGFEAAHWSMVGLPSAPDSEILSFALANRYVILTHDLDFGTLLAAGGSPGPSVVQVRVQDVLPAAIGEVVVRAIRAAESQLEKGAIVTIDPVRQRIRILPI